MYSAYNGYSGYKNLTSNNLPRHLNVHNCTLSINMYIMHKGFVGKSQITNKKKLHFSLIKRQNETFPKVFLMTE